MSAAPKVFLTGMGVVTAIGHDVPSFAAALRKGACGVDYLTNLRAPDGASYLGAEIRDFDWQSVFPDARARKILQSAPESTRLSACAALQAFQSSCLTTGVVAPEEISVIVGGNNISPRYAAQASQKFLAQPDYLNPRFALSFFDTNQVGCLSEILGIRGSGCTVGGASASGNLAVHNAAVSIRAGESRCVLVCGACADFTELEFHGFSILGAMAASNGLPPSRACRPFDRRRSGFVFGQGAACVVLESADSALARRAPVYGEIAGSAVALDASHLALPSVEGEVRVMTKALAQAGLSPAQVPYVNAHGTASSAGDECECAAIERVFGADGPIVNSTKSLTGHCMYAAGVVELIACAIQLRDGFIHPNLNLDDPISTTVRFAGSKSADAAIDCALSNSFAFGGINSSIILRRTGETNV